MGSSVRKKPDAEGSPPSRAAVDTAANRQSAKWTRKELFGRILWGAARPLFALSPRPLWGWRRALLRLFGASVAGNVHIYPTVRIAIPWNLTIGAHAAVGDRAILYALGPIRIGERCTISQGAHLCAGSHDYRDPTMPLIKSPITIGDEAWICADAFVGPGVTVGKLAIVGARAVVMKNVDDNVIVVGNPAREIRRRSQPSAGPVA
jgi:putative colanic acid biosynthesis acetyltransferase WcaF